MGEYRSRAAQARFGRAVAANPSRYRLAPGETPAQMRARLGALGDTWAAVRWIAYIRSDDSEFSLPLAAVLLQKAAFEAAFSPNDCSELRWGAAADSDEAKARLRDIERRRSQDLGVVPVVGQGRLRLPVGLVRDSLAAASCKRRSHETP